MSVDRKSLVGLFFALLCTASMAGPVTLEHDEFMPEDVYGLRTDKPDQMLFQISSYRLTIGSEARPGGLNDALAAGVWLFAEGRSLAEGSPVRQAQIEFLNPGSRPRPARLDPATQTLFLYYPLAYLETVLSLIDAPGPAYVQARFYGNGTIWADLHAGPIELKR
ncbi:MAG TPA: hypothetical protein ENI17_16585 [Pseudomonas xinjiangensis]|uniref:Uncharacterized protein n=2 Tax=root TaxID=1 RepID=A0A7V1BMH6_9GAMM|nr:hypothetical protein [Halopseudomonas xinjiangensis]HEC49221.1 hypothetical protein [Halopseudomonas xinjiangensis]